MGKTKKKPKYQRGYSLGQKLFLIAIACAMMAFVLFAGWQIVTEDKVKETEETTFGIDVARYQGTIDWEKVGKFGVDFAMVRVGYRSMTDGEIVADTNARYNMQEAPKYGIKLGAYFFSTAVSEEEAIEEANWVADYISQYPITYPVAYDCEGYAEPDSRQYHLSREERTDIALAFLKTIEDRGYEGMFYASKNTMEDEAHWEISRIEEDYKVWVAQYPAEPYPVTMESSYTGTHQMWQHSQEGQIPGISASVDRNVAYFGYDGVKEAKNTEPPEEAFPDPEAMMDFQEVNESVTAKIETNLRSLPSQDTDSQVLYTLKNGEIANRIAVSPSGWSKLVFEGETYYAVSSFLTTDMNYTDPSDDGIETPFKEVEEQVTAKELVNLRSIPSVTNEGSEIVAQLKNGEVVIRTGINEDVGWSRVVYNGQVLYCISSYLTTAD